MFMFHTFDDPTSSMFVFNPVLSTTQGFFLFFPYQGQGPVNEVSNVSSAKDFDDSFGNKHSAFHLVSKIMLADPRPIYVMQYDCTPVEAVEKALRSTYPHKALLSDGLEVLRGALSKIT